MGFAAIYVADFMVQAVMRAEPGLRDCAIALLEGTPPLRKVVAANDAALRAGIELGMTESQAEDFCAVQVRSRSVALEKTAHAALMDLGWSVSPRVEDTAADTIVLDLAGLSSLLGSEEIIAERLIERASLLGLMARVAISSNLETAIHAARGFAGVTLIPAGEEAKALGGLPVGVLSPRSSRAEILETLDSWGVRTCEALGALPVLDLSERLGQEGVRLHEFARGASSRAMVLAEPDIHFEEEMELEDAVPELEPLSFLLGRLLDQLCARLAARALAASTIRVRFELEPVSENNVRSLNDSSPRKAALPTYEKVLTLPVPSRNSKMLLKLLRLRLQAEPPQTAVLKIFMAAEPAKPRFAQGGLFLPSSPDPEKLELTIARLANLVGEGNVGAPEICGYASAGCVSDATVCGAGSCGRKCFQNARRESQGGRCTAECGGVMTIANRLRMLIGHEWRFAFTGLLCRRASRCERDGWRGFRLTECAVKWWRRRDRGELREIGGAKMGGNTMSGISMCVLF